MADQNEMDEAYMQDAIAAAKATGALHEVNPQDAPAPVQQGGFAAQVGRRETPSLPDAKLSAEDKAFSELEKQLARREKGDGQGQGRG